MLFEQSKDLEASLRYGKMLWLEVANVSTVIPDQVQNRKHLQESLCNHNCGYNRVSLSSSKKAGWRRRILNKEDLVAEECRAWVSSRLGPSPPSYSQSGNEAPQIGKSPKNSQLKEAGWAPLWAPFTHPSLSHFVLLKMCEDGTGKRLSYLCQRKRSSRWEDYWDEVWSLPSIHLSYLIFSSWKSMFWTTLVLVVLALL